MEIKILNFRLVNDVLLKALVDIEIAGWIVKCLRITQHEGRKPYLVMTKGNVLDTQTGRVHMEQTVFLPADLWIEVEKIVLSKFEEETSKGNGNSKTN